MTPLRLQIDRWAAWAPGLESQEAWKTWLADGNAVPPEPAAAMPPLAEMPAMMRRRIEPLGRIALQAAYWAQGEEGPTGPVVFASRWGEIARSIEMLQQLAAGEPLSPTAFSLSVHNAIGALFSIARGDRNNYQAVSAGAHSVEAGFAEASGLIADGAARVLLVCFEAPLPSLYQAHGDADNGLTMPRAFALMLSRAASDRGLRLASQVGDASSVAGLPSDLRALRFLVAADPRQRSLDAGRWRWQRDDDQG
ncbi:beta-ketoacyl synthase chain length factor [Paucibacter sp. R3-3]|uniref:Beta-ketoacyl synthase chain length factor n=1 Tax=Roseateles agri TaxID=3098619 RepID=A0ABU5DFG9_9BURK|nr:beta-ketoacyl synthase chain length factor [Paucibacter sp. R3-3]MDY0745025.1 beta-ketoacyl synthase chain length factor [Paucibacter sp. R3-3]